MKIGLKLTVIMIALGLVSSGVISIVLLVRAQTNITDLADKYLLSLGEKEANEITSYLEEYWHTVQSIGHTMEQYTYMVQGNRRNMFNVILEGQTRAHPEVIGMWCVWERDVLEGNDQAYIGTKGTNSRGYFTPYYYWEGGVVKLDAVEDFDVPGPGDCYLITKKNDATTILDPYVYDGQIMTTVATPIRNNGRQIGVVGIDIFLDELQRISQTSKPFPDSLSAVFSNDFTVAAHFATDSIGQNATQTEVPLLGPYMNDVKQAAKDGKFFKFTRYIDVLDNTLTCMFIPIRVKDSNTPWSVASGSMVSTVFAPLHDMQRIAIVIISIVVVLIAAAAVFLARSITKPIVNIAGDLREIAEGEGDLTRRVNIQSKDEVGDLAKYFNDTVKKIRNLVVNIKKEAETLSEIGTDLASNMNETAAAVHQITSNIQSIKGRIINQSASVTETNATMEQVTVNIDKLNGHVENQSRNVSQASAAIEEMVANISSVTDTLVKNGANVKTLQGSSEVGRNGLQGVAADIQEIARNSEGFLEINAVMENIASQTNLLSMNAAIEAAHAGEAGKGFAVVAAEIRKLAESSSTQSKTISDVLKKIKTSIDKITKSTENVLTRFEDIDSSVNTVAQQEESIRNAMEEQGHGSKQILEGVGNVNELTRLVKASSQEMLEGAQEVIKESQNLEKATQEITSGMNEMANGAEQINIAVHQVNDISTRNREGIETLIKEVSRFKV